MIPLSAYVAVSAVLFATGLLGVLIRRNFIIVLMSVEIMLNAATINLVAFSHYSGSHAGTNRGPLHYRHCSGGSGYRARHHHRGVPRQDFNQRRRNEFVEVVTCPTLLI
jgi:hypothetical protein